MKKRVMTAARKRALRKAQLASARKRKKRAKDTLGYWVAKGIRKAASHATFGLSGMLLGRPNRKKKKK